MAILMDDPTTYLKKDADNVVLFVADSVTTAMARAAKYGVAIQVNMAGGVGIRVITTKADAINAKATYPNTTPWTVVDDEHKWDIGVLAIMTNFFGPAKTMDKALGVVTDGIAWRPDRYPVYGM